MRVPFEWFKAPGRITNYIFIEPKYLLAKLPPGNRWALAAIKGDSLYEVMTRKMELAGTALDHEPPSRERDRARKRWLEEAPLPGRTWLVAVEVTA